MTHDHRYDPLGGQANDGKWDEPQGVSGRFPQMTRNDASAATRLVDRGTGVLSGPGDGFVARPVGVCWPG